MRVISLRYNQDYMALDRDPRIHLLIHLRGDLVFVLGLVMILGTTRGVGTSVRASELHGRRN
jgi:hypothetical protein